MRVMRCTDSRVSRLAASVLTVGCFDGIHLGHLALMRRLKDRSSRLLVPSVVLTFEPHPLAVLAPKAKPALITPLAQRVRLLERTGIDCLAIIPFSQQFAQLSAEAFVSDYLCGVLGVRHMVVGHDYAFGRGRQGNYETLVRLGEGLGFSVEALPALGEGERVFSSTLVRRLVAGGDTLGAAAILGRSFSLVGQVAPLTSSGTREGAQRVRITPDNELLPQEGHYAVHLCCGERLLPGICRIARQRSVEIHLEEGLARPQHGAVTVLFGERLGGAHQLPVRPREQRGRSWLPQNCTQHF